jgi:hypothetical protein
MTEKVTLKYILRPRLSYKDVEWMKLAPGHVHYLALVVMELNLQILLS